jgi:hypothetical protein
MDANGRGLKLHTLGPPGTNCEAAAHFYLRQRGDQAGDVLLYETLEKAVVGMLADPRDSALLGCVVYPQLNEIVFRNLAAMSLRDCFVMPTYPMVLASRDDAPVSTVISHPAPVHLLDGRNVTIILANSNSAAAIACASGKSDACITTSVAAEAWNLRILEDFGPVPMGFSIHAPHGTEI